MPEYIIISNLVVERNKTTPHRNEHLNYLTELKINGNLKLAGKYSDGSGGLYVLNTDSYNQAIDLANKDPYHYLGFRKYTIKEWERKL